MSTQAKICTLTLNPALDKSTALDRLIPEQKLRCKPFRLDAGGGGINVAKAVRRLGSPVDAVFPSGGQNGLILSHILQAERVAVHTVKVEGEVRENISILEAVSNAQYRLTTPGFELKEADADKTLHLIEQLTPGYLVVSGSLPPGLPDTYLEKVAAFAKKISARLILDTSGAALRAAADEGLYLLKPNLAELSALVGVEKLEIDDVDEAAMQIIAQGKCEVVVVSLGPQGAMLVTKCGHQRFAAPVVHKMSTVGAGDSMVAGMVWALSQGKGMVEMVQTGIACGTAATMNEGTELFHLKDVERLLEWIKKHQDSLTLRF